MREITITIDDHDRIRAVADDGSEVSGKAAWTDLYRDVVELFDKWLREKKIERRRELEVFGSILYHVIFEGKVGEFYRSGVKALPNGERLRLHLSFTNDGMELARLPWEYLNSGSGRERGWFLATDKNHVLARYIPMNLPRDKSLAPDDLPLRLLVVVSKPNDLGAVVEGPVLEAIEETAKELGFKTRQCLVPTLENLGEALEEFRPHVLQYVGHAKFDPDHGESAIALLNDDGRSVNWQPGPIFAESLHQAGAVPRLVLLHACEGAQVDLAENFAGLAPQLIRIGSQAVVAMQYTVTNLAAITFTKAFYAEIMKGRPVDEAVQIARWAIVTQGGHGYDNRDFGAPVLYMRSRTGVMSPKGGNDE